MNDLIWRHDVVKTFAKFFSYVDDDMMLRMQLAINQVMPASLWIPCEERMPAINYDHDGNWVSEEVILLMNDDEFVNICNGHFNPAGVFETYEKDGPAYIGLPVRDVKAWMPLPDPWEGDKL